MSRLKSKIPAPPGPRPTKPIYEMACRNAIAYTLFDDGETVFSYSRGHRTFNPWLDRGLSHSKTRIPENPPHNCAATNGGTSAGRMPANVSLNERAIVTAGFANDVDAVNQYAAAI